MLEGGRLLYWLWNMTSSWPFCWLSQFFHSKTTQMPILIWISCIGCHVGGDNMRTAWPSGIKQVKWMTCFGLTADTLCVFEHSDVVCRWLGQLLNKCNWSHHRSRCMVGNDVGIGKTDLTGMKGRRKANFMLFAALQALRIIDKQL